MARRTVHTLMGSYVALSTSTRPPDQRPAPSGLRSVPRVVSGRHRPQWAWWYSCRHDLAECSYGADGNEPSTRTPSRMGAQRTDRLGHGRIVRAAVEVDEEHVVAEPSPPRPRLDAGEVDLARRRTRRGSARASPAGRRSAPRTSARSSTRRPRRGRAPRGAIHTKRVSDPGRVLDVRGRAPRSRRARRPRGCRCAAHGSPSRRARRPGAPRRRSRRRSPPRRPASRVRRNVAHWPLACGCEATAAIRSSGDRRRARSGSGGSDGRARR